MNIQLLRANLFTPTPDGAWGLPLLALGQPGTAKSAGIESLCASYHDMPCEVLSPSERGEGAFGVVPVPSRSVDDRRYLTALTAAVVKYAKHDDALARAMREVPKSPTVLSYPAPEWVTRFLEGGRGVIFVDELTSTPPALQAPLMGLALARRIGGVQLPGGVRIIAAANPPDVAASGYDLAAPLANRFGHIDWSPPTVPEHTAYMLRGATANIGEEPKTAAEEEARVLDVWPSTWARAVGLETSFLRARPNLKNVMPKAGDPKAGRAWPSDRSWRNATSAFASGIVHDLSNVDRETFVEAFIGAGAAGEWFAWMADKDIPDAEDVLDGKVVFEHSSKRLDRTCAVLGACVVLVANKAVVRRIERAKALWALLEKMAVDKADLDILVPTVGALIDSELHAMKEATKTLSLLNAVLKRAGRRPGGGGA